MRFETIAEGLIFPEGPVALPGGALLLVDTGAGTVLRIEPEGKISTIAMVGGGPNGAAIGPDGAAYICNNGGSTSIERVNGRLRMRPSLDRYEGGSIQRVDLETGRISVLYDHCDDEPLLAPNDLVFDRTGGFWFTDSGRDEANIYRKGAIYYAAADGSGIKCVKRGLTYPNGIGLSPDGHSLCWSSTTTGRVFADPLNANGVFETPRPWSQGNLLHNCGGEELLDSLAVEADGRVCVARVGGGIRVIETSGEWTDVAVADPVVTNLCFGGDDMREIWITAAGVGKVLKGRWPRPGLPLAF